MEELNIFDNFEETSLKELKGRDNIANLKEALRRLDHPEKCFKTIHVAGTKGKGSVSSYISSIISGGGYKTGLFTSPHIETPCERISINGVNINEADMSDIYARMSALCGGLINPRNFSYFEILTLIAIQYFKRCAVDYAVFECGLGGRLDATNVIYPEICVFSNISLDHTDILGESIKDIASEKSAIIKKGTICLSASQKEEAKAVLTEKCRDEKVPLSMVGTDITYEINKISTDGVYFSVNTVKNTYQNCFSSMNGFFQAENAAIAIGVCEVLFPRREEGMGLGAVKEGIKNAFMPGRMEQISERPVFILDGAQNYDSFIELERSIRAVYGDKKMTLILGLSSGKDVDGVGEAVSGFFDICIITKADNARAIEPSFITEHINTPKSIVLTSSVNEAMDIAFKKTGDNDIIIAAGSFFVIAEVKKIFKKVCLNAG